ncbi:transposase [Xanthobacter sediminis]
MVQGRARRQGHRALHSLIQEPQRPYPHDKALYRQRHKVENLFAKLKDWRRIATPYDRCAHTFFSAICIASTVIFWL